MGVEAVPAEAALAEVPDGWPSKGRPATPRIGDVTTRRKARTAERDENVRPLVALEAICGTPTTP